jgi:hypothetical protein
MELVQDALIVAAWSVGTLICLTLIVVFGPTVRRTVGHVTMKVLNSVLCELIGAVWVPGSVNARPPAHGGSRPSGSAAGPPEAQGPLG